MKRKVTDTPGRFAMPWRAGELSWRSCYLIAANKCNRRRNDGKTKNSYSSKRI
ncbi:hypothetical protein [Gemella cuniculi]|uniref:hypothetical protein n=1 Tax=Gemella cuniculi TaxID=150240 RepID=UPI00146D1E50|nr:hypothetical protein [Gemella cuniculi]